MAVHTGEADVRDGDYYGAPTRCAGIAALAHVGQVPVSATTAAIVRDDLPEDISEWLRFRERVHSALVRLSDPPALEAILLLQLPTPPRLAPAGPHPDARYAQACWLQSGQSVATTIVRLRSHERTGQPYAELGVDYFDRLDAARIERHHVRRLEQLGYSVALTPMTA
jgi:hypothetical protein